MTTLDSSPSLRLAPVANWAGVPRGGANPVDVSDVAVDAKDRVYLLMRDPGQILVYDADGRFLRGFGEGILSTNPHGLAFGLDGFLYCADQFAQVVRKFSTDGAQVAVLGTGDLSDTGMDWSPLPSSGARAERKRRWGNIIPSGPFNHPTSAAVAPDGHVFVSDGYGNSRVHEFSPTGELLASWGATGTGPGEFHIPHCVHVTDDGTVFVADRENDRLQVFSERGDLLALWPNVRRPTAVTSDGRGRIYVAQMASPRGHVSWVHGEVGDPISPQIIVFDRSGQVLLRVGENIPPWEDGGLMVPHGIAVDSEGNIYVAETARAALTPANQEYTAHPGDKVTQCPAIRKWSPC